ncbi:MAG: hypothetical protein WBG70_19165 [Spirulinaceae cyanobacterium]
MTSHQDIQSLIADLDNLLLNADTDQQEVLEEVRSYLVTLPLSSPQQSGEGDLTATEQRTAEAIAKAVLGEMESLRAEMTGSVEKELAVLRQQREAMEKDIKRLEVQQQQMMAEFLQKLGSSCVETLTREVTNTLEKLEMQFLSNNSPDTPAAFQHRLRLEQLQQFQRRSDRLLVNLDTTLQTVFQTLERNLYSYQESLSQSAENIHSLGQQGETMFTFLINRLLQQLGEPDSVADAQKESDLQPPEEEAEEPVVVEEISPLLPEQTQLFPFAGTEITSPGEIWQEEEDLGQPQKSSEVDNLLYLDLSREKVALPGVYGRSDDASEFTEEVDTQNEEENSDIDVMEDVLFDSSENVEANQFAENDSKAESNSPQEVLFGEKVTEESDEVEQVETITALTDVLEQAAVDLEQITDSEEGEVATRLNSDLEDFVPASPHENLLPTEDRSREAALPDIIDTNTLEKLNEDLELFEEGGKEEDEGPDTEIQLADGETILAAEESEPDTEIQLVEAQETSESLALTETEESEPDTEIQLVNSPNDIELPEFASEDLENNEEMVDSSSSSDAEVLTPPEELLGENLENLLIESFANEQELSSQLQMDKITGFSQEFFWDESEEEEEKENND